MSQDDQHQHSPEVTQEDILQRAAIDKSTRLPVLFFFTSAAAWLLAATLLGLISSIKLVAPGFLGIDWLNYGRSQPAFLNALLYGWAFQAGFGVMIWMMARLCRTELKNPITLVVAGHFWNLGVSLGVIGILAGLGTPMKWLEFPSFAWPILLISYSLIVVWLVVMFTARRKGHVFISQWYLLTACFTFPWLYLTANLFLNVLKKSGVAGPAIASWYANNVLFLWLVPVGLASAYFIIPKIVGKPIHSYQLATLAFWGLVGITPWAGAQELVGGPLPAIIPAFAGAAQVLLLIPVLAVAFNHYLTVKGNHNLVELSPSLRFTFFGSIGYVVVSVMAALLSSMTLARYTGFSYAQDAVAMTGIYMFFTMTMFGAIYFIVPRVTGCEWISGARIRFHFWWSAYACIALCVLLFAAGFSHGAAIDTWDTDLQSATIFSQGYLIGRILIWLFITAANLVFLVHLALMVMNRGRKAGTPTLIHQPAPADQAEPVIITEGAEA
ncbi:MAG: cbb3-type cytochrome c oxidase subunit I [Verrucomicrobiota bacterium]